MKITLEELLFRIEKCWDDEGLQSNQWENKHDLSQLKRFLGEFFIQIGKLVYIQIGHDFYQVDYSTYESIDSPFETIDLFELEDFIKVDKIMLKKEIKKRQVEVKSLNILLDVL